MIELIVKHEDGRKMCHELKDGQGYDVRGDEVSFTVTVPKKRKKKAE